LARQAGPAQVGGFWVLVRARRRLDQHACLVGVRIEAGSTRVK